jgi:TRAP transporter TAXI family solute receptor
MISILLRCLMAIGMILCIQAPQALAKTTFVTIGTGGMTGVYYPTGGAIARMINKKKEVYGIRCTYEATGGSVFNVNAVMSGDLEFGVVQSDRQYQAYFGSSGSEWTGAPQKELRSVFSIHPESVTLVAAVDSGITHIRELVGKRVNIGNHGSGHRQNAIDALFAVGINYENDVIAESVKAAEAPKLLQDGRIDAFFYTVGHPSGAFKEATAGRRKIAFIPITGLDALFEATPYYTPSQVPVHHYPGAENKENVDTFGVKATLVTSSKIPSEVVYAVTKVVFDNLVEFKKLHPAYEVLTKENMMEGLSAPLHDGAMRYYKEVGLK